MACKESICKNCFHSYVCEQFNENKDDNNEKCHFFNDHYVPRADVAPKSEVAREILSDLKKQVHDKAVYPNSQDVPSYISLKVFDAVLNNYIKKYMEGGE